MNRSIQEFGVRPGKSAAENAAALQAAIDWASSRGGALFVVPVEEPYAVDGGVVLRRNVSLTVSLVGCRMRNYAAAEPITVRNPHARIETITCI